MDAARRWAADRRLTADDELSYLHEYEHLTLARVLLGRGRRSNEATAAAASGSWPRPRTAAGSAASSRSSSCWRSPTRPRATAPKPRHRWSGRSPWPSPEGYVRVFLDEGPELLPLLRARRPAGAPGHARRAPAPSRAGEARRPVAQPGLVDELSDRELEVLRLLRSELSGPEIARELFVSLNTLRTHTKSIYTKLGVNSRRAAVRRAAELGL